MQIPAMNLLVAAVIEGDQARAAEETRNLLARGILPDAIITDGIEAAMAQLDAKCTVEQFNLLEIMLAGRAATSAMRELFPTGTKPAQTKGVVVMASLEGDVHDLGKNIVKVVLTAKGYRVVDCGKDCPVDRLLDTAAAEGAMAVGVSGLLTTVIPQVRQLRAKAAQRGLTHLVIVAGGAALKQASPATLNVDYVAETVFDGARYLDRVFAGDPT